MDIDKIRSEIPITKEYVYLNNAAVGPLPQRVLDAVNRTTREKIYGEMKWMDWEAEAEETRKIIAQLINAHQDEIALMPNTSEGLGIVANGILWEKNDNIITTDLEFTSNLFPWQVQAKKNDIELRIIRHKNQELLMEDFEKRMDQNTKLIAVSHVQFSNGFTIDLERLSKLAHENDAYVVTDAVQSVGQMPIDVRKLNADFLATSGYKWLLSPVATGFLYIKKELIDELQLSIVGYRSAEDMHDFSYREFSPAKSARRFEHGQLNFPGFAGMHEAILFLQENNPEQIRKRVLDLTDIIIKGVQDKKNFQIESTTKLENRSGIVRLGCKDSPEKIQQQLREKGIIISVREGGLRVSPYFYNTEEEIEEFLNSLP